MAIKTESYMLKGREFIRTFSDANRYVVRDEISYSEACDPADLNRTYTEGDLIPTDETALADKAEAYDILVGGAE